MNISARDHAQLPSHPLSPRSQGFGTSVLVYYVLARYVKPIPGLETSGWKEAKHYEPEDDVMEDSPTVIYSEPLGKSSGDSDDGKGA